MSSPRGHGIASLPGLPCLRCLDAFMLLILQLAMASVLPTFLTADELAAVLRCKPEKVYRLAASGELPSYKVEGRRLFEQGEVARWLEGRRIAGTRRASLTPSWRRSAPTRPPRASGATRSATARTGHAIARASSRSTGTPARSSSMSSGAIRPASSTRRRRSGSASSPQAWLDRYVIGAAGRVRPRPRSIRIAEDCLRALAPLNDLSVERLRRAVVEDHIATIAERAPRRAEMALSLLKRILRDAEERGQMVDPVGPPDPDRQGRGARAALPHLGRGRGAALVGARVRRTGRSRSRC